MACACVCVCVPSSILLCRFDVVALKGPILNPLRLFQVAEEGYKSVGICVANERNRFFFQL